MEREISIILKVKGTEAAKKAVQDVFDQKTATLVKTFNDQTKKAGDNLERAGRKAKGASQGVTSFTKTLGRSLSVLYLYQRAWSTFGSQFDEGLQLQRASTQFERHVGNVTRMLPELRTATKGVVSDFDLLKTAQRAFQQGIKPQNIATAFKLGTSAAQKLGMSATEAISVVTNAMTKQDEGALNTLGIVTKVNQAYQTQTALIAKNGGVMSKAMGIQIRQSLIMRELQNRFGGVNKAQEDGLMSLERLRASWKNFRATLGETLGHALLPLTRALTGVLELVTRLLEKLNKTEGFKRFVQLAGTLAGIWAGAKFIGSVRSLMSLFGIMGSGGASRGLMRVAHNTGFLSKAFGTKNFLKGSKVFSAINKNVGKLGATIWRFLPGLRSFVGALSLSSPALARGLSLIPGWGTAIVAVLLLIKPFTKLMTKAWAAVKVFFQLMNNFDENSGLSKVLREDAEELGSAYNLIENIAKISLEAWAMLKGIGKGLSEAFSPVTAVLGYAIDKIEEFTGWLFEWDKISVRSSSRLDAITEKWAKWVKIIGLGASALALFVPGLQAVGAAGIATFGTALAKDMLPQMGTSSVSNSSNNQWAPQSASPDAQFLNSNSTKPTTSPTPRAMNLDYSDDMSQTLRDIDKKLGKQTGIMETEVQMNEIEKSQSSAQRNINIRR